MARPTINLPAEPDLIEVNVWPCMALNGHDEAMIRVSIPPTASPAYCITKEDLMGLLQNLIQMDSYKNELIEMLRSLADIKEEE